MTERFLFKMPDIGEGVVEGEVIAWLKKEGDTLAKDEPVIVVMTDKATVELPTPYAGVLTKQFYQVGEIAKKDQPLFEVEVAGVISKQPKEKKLTKPASQARDAKAEAPKDTPVSRPVAGKALAAPPVRKLARNMGIPLHLVPGTGPGGRVTAADLCAFHGLQLADAQPATAKEISTPMTHLPGDTEAPLRGIQNLMAKKMVESAQIIPHFSYFDQADATRLVQLQNNMRTSAEAKGIRLSFMPFFIKALSLVLKKYPKLNSSVDAEKNSIILHQMQNIGIAMTTPLGLIVPNLKAVEKMGLFDLIYAYEELKAKAKTSKLSPSDMKEGTISITNFGALAGKGVFATPLINYPEVAILGVARIHKQPVVIHNQEMVRDMLNCSWSFDHRLIDGDLAAKASSHFVHLIENPAQLL